MGYDIYKTFVTIIQKQDFQHNVEFRFENPVLIYAKDKLRGAAILDSFGNAVTAEITIPYSCPERLDFEIGKRVVLQPTIVPSAIVETQDESGQKARIPTVYTITRLDFT